MLPISCRLFSCFRPLVLLSLLFLTPPLLSQTLVYPVRVGHKWGYANGRGRVVIAPKYEAFSETNLPWNVHPEPFAFGLSPFRLVESDGKVGVTDRTLREVLPCAYKRIRPISTQYFAVETDSMFVIINHQLETVVAERFDDVCAIDTFVKHPSELFFVKRNGLWGVLHLKKGLIIPIQYEDIASTQNQHFFRIKPTGSRFWGLIDDQNRTVLPPEFVDIRAVSRDFIAILREGRNWEAIDAAGAPLFDPKWTRAEILNRHLVWLQDNEKRSALWCVSKRDWVPQAVTQASAFFPMDDRYVVSYGFGARGLMDSIGRTVIPLRMYDSITPSGLPDCFRVRTLAKYWGLIRPGMPNNLLNCRFQSLEPFRDSLSIVCASTGCGVYNGRMQAVITPAFDRIEREGDTLNVFGRNDELLRYQIGRGGTLILVESFDDVVQIKIGVDRNFVEARPFQESRTNTSRSNRSSSSLPGDYFLTSKDTVLTWEQDFSEWKLLRKRPGNPIERLYPTLPFVKVEPVTPQDLTAVYRGDLTAQAPLMRHIAPGRKGLNRLTLFRFATGKFVTTPEFIGIRINDFRWGNPRAVFLDTLGRMGLIDREGRQVTRSDGSPLRFTYIGDFIQGKARVCLNGVLRPPLKDEDYLPVESCQLLAARFGLRDPSGELAPSSNLVVAAAGQSVPRWGYMDTLGNIVLTPAYDFAYSFDRDTMAVVVQNGRSGLINAQGERKIDCKYLKISSEGDGVYKVSVKNPHLFYFSQQGHQYCPPLYYRYLGFSEGMCAVRRDSLWGFINSTGQERIACRYEQVRPFSGGLAAVLDGGVWAVADTSGALAFKTDISKANARDLGNFTAAEGLCRFKSGGRWGYFDRRGQVRIAATFFQAGDFCLGTAPVRMGARFGLIDTTGRYVLEPKQYFWIGPFDPQGLAQVRTVKDGPMGLLDTRGKLVAPIQYASIDTFFGGFARAKSPAGWALLNTRGQEVIPAGAYAGLTRASEGMVAVLPHLSAQWMYVDTSNRKIINRLFDKVSPFQGGYALVDENRIVSRRPVPRLPTGTEVKFLADGIFGMESNRGAYFANARGENLFGRYYEDIKAFENGIGKVKKSNKWGAVNRRGIALVRPKFNFVHPQPDGNLIVRPPFLYGLVSKTGENLVEPAYDSIEWLQGNVFKLELGEQVGYLRRNGKWLWAMGN